MKKLLLSLVLCTVLTGCSWLPFWNSKADLEKQDMAKAEVLGVNPYLWQATVTKLSFMPLQSADSRGGVVITEWAKMNENSDEAFKISVSVLTKELRADGLKVTVFKKEGNGSEQADPRLASDIERSILVEARKILRRRVAAGES